MKKKEENENSFFGGFEAVVDGLARVDRAKPGSSKDPDDGFETITEVSKDSGDFPITDPSEITGNPDDDIINEEPKDDKKETNKKTQKGRLQVDEPEVEDEPEPVAKTTTTDSSDLGEYEQDVVDFFTDKFTNELGWELPDETKPKTVSDVIEYMKGIVESSSQPQYASEDIEKLNAYVANGGDLKKYYNEVYGSTDLDMVDISSESVQKKILSDNFTRMGYSPDKINKFLSRYEDSGTLQEEAEDALEGLKEYNQQKAEKLLADQENARKEHVKQQQNFLSNVYTSIDKTDSILGIPISAKEKKELRDYIFKPEADGLTKYQKDYAKDNKNLIESAYITMKGNTLIQKVTQKATSQAAKNLQDKLAYKGNRVKNSSSTQGGSSETLEAWNAVTRQLRRPNF